MTTGILCLLLSGWSEMERHCAITVKLFSSRSKLSKPICSKAFDRKPRLRPQSLQFVADLSILITFKYQTELTCELRFLGNKQLTSNPSPES